MKSRVWCYMLLPALLISFYTARGQNQTAAGLKNHVAAITAIRQLKPIEKLYIQTDKPYYTVGDTLRFKGYLLNADYLTPSERSGQLYVELDGLDGKAVKRIMVPVDKGQAWGDIALDGKDIPEGNYTFRAYTNWQRNFGEDYIFKKNISIAATKGGSLLIKAGFAITDWTVVTDGTKPNLRALRKSESYCDEPSRPYQCSLTAESPRPRNHPTACLTPNDVAPGDRPRRRRRRPLGC